MVAGMSDALTLTLPQIEAMPVADAQAALEAWVAARRTELPQALAASKSKPHAKLAKQALYRLRSSGLEVSAPVVESPATLPPAPAEEFPAVLSGILGTGERALFFARPVRGGGLEVFQGVMSDEQGLIQLEGGTSKRGVYRARMKELEDDATMKVLLVPWSRMQVELGRAIVENDRARNPITNDVMDIIRHLGLEPDHSTVTIDAPKPGDEALGSQAASLYREKELFSWLPSEPIMLALGDQITALEQSPLELTQAQRFEQFTARANAAALEYLTPERRRIYARRLHATAELFAFTKRPEQATLAEAEARALEHGTARSLFFEAMFARVLEQRLKAGQAVATR
jgi:hypothetical protein